MTKKLLIVSLALGLTACASSKAPLDDAYYWPDESASSETTQTTQTTESSIEYLDVQDTTVTIRIKK